MTRILENDLTPFIENNILNLATNAHIAKLYEMSLLLLGDPDNANGNTSG
jgi:hypothetical protein